MLVVPPAVHCPAASPPQSVDLVLHHCKPANQRLACRGLAGLETDVQSTVLWCNAPSPHRTNRDNERYRTQPETNIRKRTLHSSKLINIAFHPLAKNVMVELINHTYFEAEINSGINHYIKGKGEGKGIYIAPLL